MSLALVCLPSIGVDGSLGDCIECLRSPQCGHVVEIPTFAGCPDGCCGCEVPSPCALGCFPDDWCGWCLLYNLPNDGNESPWTYFSLCCFHRCFSIFDKIIGIVLGKLLVGAVFPIDRIPFSDYIYIYFCWVSGGWVSGWGLPLTKFKA